MFSITAGKVEEPNIKDSLAKPSLVYFVGNLSSSYALCIAALKASSKSFSVSNLLEGTLLGLTVVASFSKY
jgi:hypothetical protein